MMDRSDDLNPYQYAFDPLPSSSIELAQAAGSNWEVYPTSAGLISSLRALSLHQGLLDHWL